VQNLQLPFAAGLEILCIMLILRPDRFSILDVASGWLEERRRIVSSDDLAERSGVTVDVGMRGLAPLFYESLEIALSIVHVAFLTWYLVAFFC
jgi:hypothetical protein